MGQMTLAELFRINPYTNSVLVLCSVLVLYAIFERLWAFSKLGTIDRVTADRIKQAVRQGQTKEAISLCARTNNFVTHALEVALNAASFPREEMESIFALYRMKLQSALNRNLSILGTIAFIGPLIGLLGTVLGVIRAFRDLALSGSGGPSIVAAGIAEALIATAGGIGVALFAAVAFNYFSSATRARLAFFDQLCQEIAILIYTGSEKKR